MRPALFETHYSRNYSSNSAEKRTPIALNGGKKDANQLTSTPSSSSVPLEKGKSKSLSAANSNESLNEFGSRMSAPSSPKPCHIQRTIAIPRRWYQVKYIGSRYMDKSYTLPMLPWIVADIKRQSIASHGLTDVSLELIDFTVKVVTHQEKHIILVHPLQNISKFTQISQDRKCFSYLFREHGDTSLTIHTFEAQDENMVLDLFTAMREISKELISSKTGLQRVRSGSNLETILTNSHQYEVMYIGSVRMSQKRAHPKVIDEAVEKFIEMEKLKDSEENLFELRSRQGSTSSVTSLANIPDENNVEDAKWEPNEKHQLQEPRCIEIKVSPTRKFIVQPVIEEGNEKTSPSSSPAPPISQPTRTVSSSTPPSSSLLLKPATLIPNTQSLDADSRVTLLKDLHDFQNKRHNIDNKLLESPDHDLGGRKRSVSGDISESIQQQRSRLGSGGSVDLGSSRRKNVTRYQNKTLLFLIGRFELCLISTDKHKIVLQKTFDNISHCSQGVTFPDHFGLICREPAVNSPECYVIHVFRCQGEKLVTEIMQSLKQAFSNAYQAGKNRSIMFCETCPMNFFHRLCCDVEGFKDDKAHAVILSRIEVLNEREQEDLMRTCHKTPVYTLHEQNELYMIMLKELCEKKQKKHVHVNLGEKGLLEKKMDSINSIKEKAKSSITNTFESLIRHATMNSIRKRASTLDNTYMLQNQRIRRKKMSRTESSESMSSPHSPGTSSIEESVFDEPHPSRPRSNTLTGIKELHKDLPSKCNQRSESLAMHQTPKASSKTPLLNIFMKVGSQAKSPNVQAYESDNKDRQINSTNGSWRQGILNRISLSSNLPDNDNHVKKSFELTDVKKKKTKNELRELWKFAIKQQIMLIKMEKENTQLQANQNEMLDKRMKLDYEEIPNLQDSDKLWDATKCWDEKLLHERRANELWTLSHLKKAIQLGVPKNRRGEIWLFLAGQWKLSVNEIPQVVDNQDAPYRELLSNLTTQQHAILVDLGRTFPKVPFYSQTLGPGQLALFNLLKAYSLVDTEVEYCQGLSFVAGILLLHMNEEDAFEMMKHLLFHRGIREQYKPDMDALHMQLYQLTRLLYDLHYEIYVHFESHDIAPTLYAAPWFLTLFASQFPIGFVARLFDLIFLLGMEAIFRVSLALIVTHTESLLLCHSFESIMEYLKSALPAMNLKQMEQVFDQVISMDIKKRLDSYEVEYRVMQEEMHYSMLRREIDENKSRINKIKSKKNGNKAIGDEIDKLEENKHLREENMKLQEQLHVLQSKSVQLQSNCDNYLSTIKTLERRNEQINHENEALKDSLRLMQNTNQKLQIKLSSTVNGTHINEGENNSSEKDGQHRRISSSSTPAVYVTRDSLSEQIDDQDDFYEDDFEYDAKLDMRVNDNENEHQDEPHNHDSDHDKERAPNNRTQSDASNISI